MAESISEDVMDAIVQDALDDPRRGDVFHEAYAYGVEVLDTTADKVSWRSFAAAGTIDLGTAYRHEWSARFRVAGPVALGEPAKHTMRLQSRAGERVE